MDNAAPLANILNTHYSGDFTSTDQVTQKGVLCADGVPSLAQAGGRRRRVKSRARRHSRRHSRVRRHRGGAPAASESSSIGYSSAGVKLNADESMLANPVPHQRTNQCGGKSSDARRAAKLRRHLGNKRGTKRRRSSPGSSQKRRTRHRVSSTEKLRLRLKNLRLSSGRK